MELMFEPTAEDQEWLEQIERLAEYWLDETLAEEYVGFQKWLAEEFPLIAERYRIDALGRVYRQGQPE